MKHSFSATILAGAFIVLLTLDRSRTQATPRFPFLASVTQASALVPPNDAVVDPLETCLETKLSATLTLTQILELLTNRETHHSTQILRKAIHFRNEDEEERRLLLFLKPNGKYEAELYSVDIEGFPDPIEVPQDWAQPRESQVIYEERDEVWTFPDGRRLEVSYAGNDVIEIQAQLSSTQLLSCAAGARAPACHCSVFSEDAS